MSVVYEIPLSAANQSFQIQIGGIVYQLTLIWRDADQGGWCLDIADSQQTPILSGVPLVTGVDLLAQYAYLGFGGKLVVFGDSDPLAAPTFANLGTTTRLYFVVPD